MTEMRLMIAACLLIYGLPSESPADNSPAVPLEMRDITPPTSDTILFSPGMGLYLAGGSGLGYQPSQDAWALTLADIVYFRPTWNDLEPDGPESGFDVYFEPIWKLPDRHCSELFPACFVWF